MKFTKMHGAGNDYVVIDARGLEADWHSLARDMCHRRFGVGSDGLLLVLPSDCADVRMRMFNPDGSEAEMCGNGIRCLVKFALERGVVSQGDGPLNVETLAGIRRLEPLWDGSAVSSSRVDMGEPELRPERIPVALTEDMAGGPVMDFPLSVDEVDLNLTFVSMGNPHAVAFIDSPVERFPLHRIGPQVESNSLFPNKVNFSIVNVKEEGKLSARVWERGAGETMACGTGACAIAVAARLQGFIGNEVDITLPGGVLSISWDANGPVFMEGPAADVFDGEWR